MERKYGLIGFPLSHSFSKGFFAEKFAKEHIVNTQYENYPIESVDQFHQLWQQEPQLEGMNITIPHKKAVIPFLDHTSTVVNAINACNCIRKYNGKLYGYNTDVIGFEKSLQPFLQPHHQKALILGTGGAAAAVAWVLEKLGISFKYVSRSSNGEEVISYEALNNTILQEHLLIINTSPVGMYPHVNEAPNLNYEALTDKHHLYDLIYNPAETLFLTKGKERGASIQNGLEMLHLQAEASWEIWNSATPFVQ
jgi:shikimate dehydrogenase